MCANTKGVSDMHAHCLMALTSVTGSSQRYGALGGRSAEAQSSDAPSYSPGHLMCICIHVVYMQHITFMPLGPSQGLC